MSLSKLIQFNKTNHLTHRSPNQAVVKKIFKFFVRLISNFYGNIVSINAFVGVSKMTTNVLYIHEKKNQLAYASLLSL